MIARFPSYYNKFRCIADRCRHSCCVGWEIDIDDETLAKYRENGREDILCHLEDGTIRLCDSGRCPFLREDGLCRIISELGDDYTSIICREHPRFYHCVGDIIEGGIGAVCEEAARLILGSDDYAELVQHSCLGDASEETELDTISYRNRIYSTLAERNKPFSERISSIEREYGISGIFDNADEWNEVLLELEYLYPEHRGMLRIGGRTAEYDPYLERVFAYLVFRHLSVATSIDNLRARLGFCLLLCRAFENYLSDSSPDFQGASDYIRMVSEEVEYSGDNTASLIFEIECKI